MKTCIQNVMIITMNEQKEVIQNGYVVFEDGVIMEVGKEDYKGICDEVIDGHGAILMPGMINTHTHTGMIPFRSLGDDCKDRLRRYLFPLESACMNEALAYHSAKYAIAEMLLAGVTTFVDMYYFEDEIAKATDEMGARAFLGETILDFVTCDSDMPYGGYEYCKWFIPKWLHHPRITPFPAPHATNTNSEDMLKKANELAQKYEVPISLHVAEMDYEMTYFKDKYQKTPIQFLDSINLLHDRLLAAHCIHVNKEDIELMKKKNCTVAHCIGSNTKAAKGVAPIKDMIMQGIPVGLGTDGPSSGNTLDIFTQFQLFAKFHKCEHKDRSLFPSHEIVALGTIDAARALHLEYHIGSIEVGKKADLVLVETDSVNMFPIHDPYSVLVYSANASNVCMVFVDGNCLVKDKQLVNTSLSDLRSNLQKEMYDFVQKATHFSMNEEVESL